MTLAWQQYISKALDINPDLVAAYGDLGIVYNKAGKPDDAIRVSEQCLRRFHDYVPALTNLFDSYRIKNNIPKAQEYAARIEALTHHK